MPALIVNGIPTNLNVSRSLRIAHVEADLFGIMDRLAEYDPNIRATPLAQGDLFAWSIGEIGPDGVLREILRADELDQRILDRLNYIRSVPLEERIAAIEADYDKQAAARAQDDADKLYDAIGGTIHDNLFRCGFTHQPKPMSVRPLNRAARRAGRRAK